MDNTIIKIKHLCKAYENITPLKDINCEIKRNEVISIIGGSGTGKSTLIRMINLLEKPTSGKIFINDEEITNGKVKLNHLRRKVGMVFQNYNLFPNMTVIENIMFSPVNLKIMDKATAYNKAKILLKELALENKMYVYPNELSGGQRQRVAIARALAMNPEILLFDEPTSALDPTTTIEIQRVIAKLQKTNITSIIVTHDMELAKRVSTRIFYLDEGIIYESGTPDEMFNHPKKSKTIDFIKKQKSFILNLHSYDFDFLKSVSELEEFLVKRNADVRLKQNIELVFEEICAVNLLMNKKYIDETNNNINLTFSLEYLLEKKEVFCTIKYNYPNINIIDEAKNISKDILEGIIINGKYYITEEEKKNVIECSSIYQ